LNSKLAILAHRPEIIWFLATGVLLFLAGLVLVLRRPKRKTKEQFATELEASQEDRDRFIQQMDKVRLELETDRLTPYRRGAFQMILRIVNDTDLALSPVMMIYWSRSQAWGFNDPRMGRGRIEFELREFAKKTPPGQAHSYPISARLLPTTRPGDGAWISFSVKGLDKEINSNITRVTEPQV
jgi:hypothetical protein